MRASVWLVIWLGVASSAGGQCRRTEADSVFRGVALPYLARPLWLGSTGYSATHDLFIPMIAALEGDFPEWKPAFDRHFGRFARSTRRTRWSGGEPLWRAHYLFFASEYAVRRDSSSADLAPVLLESLHYLWSSQPLKLFQTGPYAGVGNRLHARAGKTGYRAAIDDLDRLTFAAAANIRATLGATGAAVPAWLDSIVVISDSILHARVVWLPDGGWLFQPGAWRDHPDMRFAGDTNLTPPERASRVSGQAEDVSHSMRWPALLLAFRRGSVAIGRSGAFEDSLVRGLAHQFSAHVLIPPGAAFDGWRTRNFMDGRNGWYRWRTQYHPAAPFELSGSLTYGWWVLLDVPATNRLYRNLADRWPLSRAERMLYARSRAEPEGAATRSDDISPLRALDVFAAGCMSYHRN